MARTYNPTLDGIRGLAILSVLMTHANGIFQRDGFSGGVAHLMGAGWIGVDLFFVLSGFLITGILLDTRASGNRVRSFYMRRVLRIFPIYYLTLFAAFLVASLKPKLDWLAAIRSWPDRLSYLLYLQNWLVLKSPNYVFANPLGHFWSLAIEEQFYLVWPWIVWRFAPKSVLRIALTGAVAAFFLRLLLVARFGPHFWIHVLTVTRGEDLLVGSALAVLAATRELIPKPYLAMMAITGISILTFILLRDPLEFNNTDAGPFIYTIGISGLALTFGALVGSSEYFVRGLTPFLNQPWLKQFGKYSYGIYVYHVPVFVMLNSFLKKVGVRFPLPLAYSMFVTVIQVAATFAVAWVSYTVLESKLLRLKRYFEPNHRTAVPFPESPACLAPASEMLGRRSIWPR